MHSQQKIIHEYDILSLYFWSSLSVVLLGVLMKLYYLSIICGLIHLGTFLIYYYKIYFSKKWIKTEGACKRYYLLKIKFHQPNWGLSNSYRPYCLYTYEVDGKTYKNDKLCILNKDFLIHEQFKKNAHYIVGKNSKTKEVDVYYNPKKPHESILVKGASSSKMIVLYSMFVIGLISLVIGLYNCPCF